MRLKDEPAVVEFNEVLKARALTALRTSSRFEVKEPHIGDRWYDCDGVRVSVSPLLSPGYNTRMLRGLTFKVDGEYYLTYERDVKYKLAPKKGKDSVSDKDVQALAKKVLDRVQTIKEAKEGARKAQEIQKQEKALREKAVADLEAKLKAASGFEGRVEVHSDGSVYKLSFTGTDAEDVLKFLIEGPG